VFFPPKPVNLGQAIILIRAFEHALSYVCKFVLLHKKCYRIGKVVVILIIETRKLIQR
jgi:hypothetical protein